MAIPADVIAARSIDRTTREIFRNDSGQICERIDGRLFADGRALYPTVEIPAVVDHKIRRGDCTAGRAKFATHFTVGDVDHARTLFRRTDLLIRAEPCQEAVLGYRAV